MIANLVILSLIVEVLDLKHSKNCFWNSFSSYSLKKSSTLNSKRSYLFILKHKLKEVWNKLQKKNDILPVIQFFQFMRSRFQVHFRFSSKKKTWNRSSTNFRHFSETFVKWKR